MAPGGRVFKQTTLIGETIQATQSTNEANNLTPIVDTDDSTRIKKGHHGKTRGKGLGKMRKSMGGKMKIEIPIGKGRPTKPTQSAKLSNELGIIAWNFLSLPNKWKELPREDKDVALIRCQGETKLEGVEPDRIEFYKHNYYTKEKGWSFQEAETHYKNMKDLKDIYASGESSMTIDEIVNTVLGTKLGYIEGLGYGPKPNNIRATQRRTTELEDTPKKAKQEAATIQYDLQK